MSFQLTERVIKLLCGRIAYERGEAYYRTGKVAFLRMDHGSRVYEAAVSGTGHYHVSLQIDEHGDVHAECNCPAFYSYNNYCKHIAAVLLGVHDMLQGGKAPVRPFPSLLRQQDDILNSVDDDRNGSYSLVQRRQSQSGDIPSRDIWIARDMMRLFEENTPPPLRTGLRFDQRMPLEVEFTLHPVLYGYRKYLFGLELKIGEKRLYIVKNIRDFLDKISRGEPYSFTKHFSYDPERYSFRSEDEAILQKLAEIRRNEQMFHESLGGYSLKSNGISDRLLPVPPVFWDGLLPLLSQAPLVQLEQDSRIWPGLEVTDGPLPLSFNLGQAGDESYQFSAQGLDDVLVMDAYGIILSEGKLIRLSPAQTRRLAELKHMMITARKQHILISPEQIEPFVERVLPGLTKFGTIHVEEKVASRMVRTQLKARLYLDRVKDRLLAGLEFQYGDIIFNPLDEHGPKRGTDLILLRDTEKERQILNLMESGYMIRTESAYFLDDEEAEYEFLYHVVPELEKLVDIYATSAVKTRLITDLRPPKISVELDERTDWLEFRFSMNGIGESEIRGLLQALEEKRKYFRLPNGALMPLESEEFQEIVNFLNEFGLRQSDIRGPEFRLPVIRGLHIQEDRGQGPVKLGKAYRELLHNLQHPGNLDFPVPPQLSDVLRDYQVYGYQWLKTLAYYRFGGILADDMGLGKTLQSIAFLISVLPEIAESGQPALIVCPASLVYNWRNELTKFAPNLKAVIADGSKAERVRTLREASQADVVITSYPLLRRDIEQFAELSFHTLILDEAQSFKNHASQTAQAVKILQAKYRFALTGTPVENSLEELWSIFSAVFPELFPSRQAFNDLSRETVAKRIRPFVLRRLKTDVLKELPEKIESLQPSELLPEQKKLYLAYLAKLQQETLKHLDADTFGQNRIRILAGLTRLRQLCCHPALFVDGYDGGSAKFDQLMEMIEECQSAGKRVLIFSQFTEMLGLIGRELGYRGLPFFYLDGKTPAAERVELCSRFNDGERDLFLISLKAGGTGLNLTGADTVILYDLWWNPAVEQQAADRAYRIGQKNIVHVIRMVAQGTVEDKMYELQQKKKHLVEEVLKPGQEAISALTEQEIREILMI
ncbi:SNF2 family N-terminal domain protein [Paenibacillus sp. oral taxon 786 str. D14]|uniref:DEAD/DEAH box helicase n=1 Tax=Paenibacillus sp. oral taxon 786 TaxID=652715 RepID=UPI0001AFD024|nr:DEAD/DEAH box helicase [Paenibacillus sp. oral taxon 786]EES75266.1 SNF2 family N-terminal domain protein [Paenibacillus sp. oral taxon 786 str. D14]